MLTWEGAWVRPAKAQLNKLRSAIENCMYAMPLFSRSPYLIWAAALGPQLDPAHQLDVYAVRQELWRLRRPNPDTTQRMPRMTEAQNYRNSYDVPKRVPKL